jgi:hypothetical protein
MLLCSHEVDLQERTSEKVSVKEVQALYNDILEPRGIRPASMLGAFCATRETNDTSDKNSLYNHHKESFAIMADDTGTGLSEAQCRISVELSDDPMVHNSIMFVTDNSRVGFAYHPDLINGIRPGDVVVGLFGYKLPLLLRKAETCSNYQIVNFAYVNETSWATTRWELQTRGRRTISGIILNSMGCRSTRLCDLYADTLLSTSSTRALS